MTLMALKYSEETRTLTGSDLKDTIEYQTIIYL